EAGIEHRTFVAAVGADHGKAALQGRNPACYLGTHGVGEAAVQAATTLEQETAVPGIGQVDGKSQRIGTSVDAGAPVNLTFDIAMRWQGCASSCTRGTGRQAALLVVDGTGDAHVEAFEADATQGFA